MLLNTPSTPPAFVKGQDFTATPGNLSTTYTCGSGPNRLLVVAMTGAQGADAPLTQCTYGGLALTRLMYYLTGAPLYNGRNAYVYYLRNPASGPNSLVIASTTLDAVVCTEYTGIHQTAPIDGTITDSAGTQCSVTLTTKAPRTWAIIGFIARDAVGGGQILAGGAARVSGASGGWYQPNLGDSNAVLSPGPHTFTMTTSGGGPSASGALLMVGAFVAA